MKIRNITGKPTTFPFDVVRCHSPAIFRLEAEQQSNSVNLSSPSTITLKRPGIDNKQRTFHTYFGNDSSGCKRK